MCALNVAQNMFESMHVGFHGIVHKETYLLNCIENVSSSKSEMLKGTY
jgi:hypothetical protein